MSEMVELSNLIEKRLIKMLTKLTPVKSVGWVTQGWRQPTCLVRELGLEKWTENKRVEESEVGDSGKGTG